jgi:hypothetical protein
MYGPPGVPSVDDQSTSSSHWSPLASASRSRPRCCRTIDGDVVDRAREQTMHDEMSCAGDDACPHRLALEVVRRLERLCTYLRTMRESRYDDVRVPLRRR